MKLALKDPTSRAFFWTAVIICAFNILESWFGFGNVWQLGLLGLTAALGGLSLLVGVLSAFRTGEIHSLGMDWERDDYYFKLIVGIHLLLAGFSFWVGIYFLKALVPQ